MSDTILYNHREIEPYWQDFWEKNKLYSPDMKAADKPFYNLMMFPYPSAEGLHVGNMYAFTGVDVYGRFKRMQGYDVFEPIGLDGFGIHSENYALKVNKHPKELAKVSQANFYRQLRATGNGYDWTRTVETYDPDYYKWTQWIFIQMFKAGLAYKAEAPVNWCPSCKTVLADEQVVKKKIESGIWNLETGNSKLETGKETRSLKLDTSSIQAQVSSQASSIKPQASEIDVCERCGTEVATKKLNQWFFRIASGQRTGKNNGSTYADSLLKNLPTINWVEKVKVGQRNWIGRKEGINIKYQVVMNEKVESGKWKIEIICFTTRPDTNFGATFIVLGPENGFVRELESGKWKVESGRKEEIMKYVETSLNKTDEERIGEGGKKTGVFTGFYAINRLNGEELPIWISDFVLGDVGTGAVVGVPGHDIRDFQFASTFGIPIKRVVVGKDGDTSEITREEQVQEESGTMINSEFLDGLDIHEATKKIMDYIEEKGWGERVVHYHLRDWLISRQRYWGAPIPMVYCKDCAEKGIGYQSVGVGSSDPQTVGKMAGETGAKTAPLHNAMEGWFPVLDDQLPVELPDVKDWKPTGTGKAPLASVPSFVQTKCPNCGGSAERETDVCDTFLDSSWYHLRYPSVGSQKSKVKSQNYNSKSKNAQFNNLAIQQYNNPSHELPWDPEITKKWLPVTSYIGGAEHTVLHLLYARFVSMVLHDLGYLHFDEPYTRFYAHGLIIKDGVKMSKSRGNVVVPDEYIASYGSDTLRTYLMFLGPFDAGGDFRDSGIAGMYKFTRRVWRIVTDFMENGEWRMESGDKNKDKKDIDPTSSKLQATSLNRVMHKTIKEVTEDMEQLRYNTAIAHMMEYVNQITDNREQITEKEIRTLLLLLAPFMPHMTEELWARINADQNADKRGSAEISVKDQRQSASIHFAPWPVYDPKLIVEEVATIIVQINGKTRDTIRIKNEESGIKEVVEKEALVLEKVKKHIKDKTIRKTIFVPGQLINFVV